MSYYNLAAGGCESDQLTAWEATMICPKCKTGDIYISQRSNEHFMSFLWVNMRCHRCCNLFSVPRWKAASHEQERGQKKKAA
jgi:hypothetical protein